MTRPVVRVKDRPAAVQPHSRVCPDCGMASTKQLEDGRCPDKAACEERRATWQ